MRFSLGLVSLSAIALLASGCSAFSDNAGGGDDGEVKVAAAFYPLAYVADRVTTGTDAEVDLLTAPGKEPHDLELTVNQTAQIVAADLVVFESGFQPSVDDAVKQNAEGETLDVVDVADLLPVDESEEDHAKHAGEDEHDHDHGDVDPHFWQDPLRLAAVGDAMADKLANIDSDNADRYRSNARALHEDLTALDKSYAAGLASCKRDTIVVSHDAFGYLEKYGLHIASIVGLSPDAEPTSAVLGELQELIRTKGITTVFSEPLEPALGEGLAADLGISNGVLDPIEGLTKNAPKGSDYLSLMNANLETLVAANGCR